MQYHTGEFRRQRQLWQLMELPRTAVQRPMFYCVFSLSCAGMFSHCYRNETLTGHLPERTWAELEQSDCITHVLPPQLRWQWSSNSSAAHQALLYQVDDLSVGQPSGPTWKCQPGRLPGQVDRSSLRCNNSSVLSISSGDKLSVEFTRQRRYGPSWIHTDDNEGGLLTDTWTPGLMFSPDH